MAWELNAAEVLAAMSPTVPGGLHASDLRARTGLSAGGLYRALVRLERAGLIQGRPRNDGRRCYRLTPAGGGTVAGGGTLPAGSTASADNTLPAGSTASADNTLSAGGTASADGTLAAGSTASADGTLSGRHGPTGPAHSRRGWWTLSTVAAMAAIFVAFDRPPRSRLPDLSVYLGAVHGSRNGFSLYAYLSSDGAPFTYPPFAGLLFRPLTYVPRDVLQVAWTLGTVVAVLAVSSMLTREAAQPGTGVAQPPPQRCRDPRPLATPLLATALLLSAPVSSALRFGQVSIGLVTLIFVDIILLRRTRAHGVLIGLAAALKLTPLIFIPMLWLAGQRKAAITAAAAFMACGAIGWVALPADSWLFWGTHMWNADRLGHITSAGNQSLHGALLRLGLAGGIPSAVALLAAAVVAAVTLRRAGRLGRRGDLTSATVVTGAASVVISPVSWTHHQMWLVLALLLPARTAVPIRYIWAGAVLAIMILPTTSLGPSPFSDTRLLLAVAAACVIPLRMPGNRHAAALDTVARFVAASHTAYRDHHRGTGATGTAAAQPA